MSRLVRSTLYPPQAGETGRETGKSVLEGFHDILVHGKTVLTEYHLEGGNATTLGQHLSWLIDQLLTTNWNRFFPDRDRRETPLLIAAGGYGRRELNLESDIDLLILLPRHPSAEMTETIALFIRFCWDVGLQVGHSARTLEECVAIAQKDLSVITNLMETRLVVGDPEPFEVLHRKLRANTVWPAAVYFKSKLEEKQLRHLHFSDTAYNLEPNIKESPGGLRDLHMISWVANRYFGTGDFAELVEHEFLTKPEYRALIKARNFLWRLRNGLHILAGRCEDRLLFDYQKELASQLGYRQTRDHLAVEMMMKRYFRTVKEVELLNEISLQHFQEAILHPRTPKPKRINARFNAIGRYLETSSETVFEQHPGAILELFLLMQQHPELEGVRATTIRQLRASLHRINGAYRKDPENLDTFLAIFQYQEGLTHALRRMNTYGVLGAFFPAFGKIVGQMQHDLFHIFTVDAHSLFVVGNLRRLMVDRYQAEFPVLRAILGQLNRRERLFLAALCHDIGKGSGKDHSEAGEKIALTLCTRLGLSEYDKQFVAWLVRNHLIMSWTAQREDTSDPRVIDRFAEFAGDQEHLDNLYLLTVADIRGTNPKVWSEWKGQLLSNLYTATSRRLRTGIGGAEGIRQRIRERKQAIRKIVGDSIPEFGLARLWDQLDQEYFLRNGPETGAWHALEIHRARLLDLPLVANRFLPEIKALQVLFVVPDSENLLLRSTGALDSLGLDILDARIHQTRSGLGILVFVTVTQDESFPDQRELDFLAGEMKKFLLDPPAEYRPRSRSLPRALKQFKVPTVVSFSDNLELGHTTMEIVSQDRPGLLYHVSVALLECKTKLVSAKVSTVGEKAEDTFFITDRDGNPVTDEQQREWLKQRIIENLE